MSDWKQDMARIAEATGENVLLGVRPKGTWFIHCDGHEFDIAGPGMEAVRAIAASLRTEAERQERSASSREDKARKRLKVLYDVLSPAVLSPEETQP